MEMVAYRKFSNVACQIIGIHEVFSKDNSSHTGSNADVAKAFIQYSKKIIQH